MKKQIIGLCLAACTALSSLTLITGCAGNQYDRSTGQYIDDKSITVRVHNALSENPEYKFNDVNVDSFKGTVQLSGFVNNSDQKAKAAEIAKTVPGVQKVENKITVK